MSKKIKIKIKVKKPWIGFCGTPIQQNYAEDLDHGYLLWDITSNGAWDVDFKKLPNPKPYVTLAWTGSIDEFIKSTQKFPNGTRFRVRSSETLGQKDFKIISEILKSEKLATEVTFKSDFIADKSLIKTASTTFEKADLRNPDVLLKLIKDYYSSIQISKEVWIAVTEQVKSYLLTAAVGDETTRNTKWSLRHLEFDNTFTYGSNNVINFDKLNGIVGVFGPNRVGKSSIIGALMYSLFNTTDRGPMKNIHVCNIRKPYCSSKAIINHDGTDYVIERQTTKVENKKGVINASTVLNLFKIKNDGFADDLVGEQRIDTEKIIKNLIGNQDDFLMTSLSAQGEINQFISQGSTRRRAILSRFLDLDIFDRMYEISNKELSVLKAQLKNFPDKEWPALFSQGKEDIKLVDFEINQLLHEIKEKQFKLSELQLELSKHKDVTPVTKMQVESFANQVLLLEQKCKSCNEIISRLELEIEENNKKLETIKTIKLENDVIDLRLRQTTYQNLETSFVSLNHVYEKELTQLKQHQKSLKILDEVPCGDEYPTCKFIKDAHISKNKLKSQEEKVAIFYEQIQKASSVLVQLEKENINVRLNKLEKLFDLESKILLEVSRKETDLAKNKSACGSQTLELITSKNKLKLLNEALESEGNAETFLIKSNIDNISKDIDCLNVKKMDMAIQKGRISTILEKVIEEKAIRDVLLEKMKVHELVTTVFSKKGIPLIITKLQMPIINVEIAKILQGIVDFTIELENDEHSDSAEIYINYGDSRRIIELCSGMEKTIASLAIRVAMINISSLPKTDIFIIDEGFGTLDDNSIEACNRLLSSFKRYFKTILVITHIDGIKDVADHMLEIVRNEKDSKIVYGIEE